MSRGIDASESLTNVAQKLKSEKGLDFVSRYYSCNAAKNLSEVEAKALSAAGLYIVTVWETNPTDIAYFTQSQGFQDACRAEKMANDVGQPHGTPIYFAVDTDVPGAGPVSEYFDGLNKTGMAGHAPYSVGVYGSGLVCSHLRAAGLANHTWLAQSKGWSGYGDLKNPSIVQGGGVDMFGISVDMDTAFGNGGGWRL